MAWNHSSRSAFLPNENSGADGDQFLTAFADPRIRCCCAVVSRERRMEIRLPVARMLPVSMPIGSGLQFADCCFYLIVCSLFAPLSFDLLVGNTLLSRLI